VGVDPVITADRYYESIISAQLFASIDSYNT